MAKFNLIIILLYDQTIPYHKTIFQLFSQVEREVCCKVAETKHRQRISFRLTRGWDMCVNFQALQSMWFPHIFLFDRTFCCFFYF